MTFYCIKRQTDDMNLLYCIRVIRSGNLNPLHQRAACAQKASLDISLIHNDEANKGGVTRTLKHGIIHYQVKIVSFIFK